MNIERKQKEKFISSSLLKPGEVFVYNSDVEGEGEVFICATFEGRKLGVSLSTGLSFSFGPHDLVQPMEAHLTVESE